MLFLICMSVFLYVTQLNPSMAFNAFLESNCGISTDTCQRNKLHVSGGLDACAANAPWNVIIENRLSKKRKKRDSEDNLIDVSCGGSLVTEKHVVTAAHCFIKNEVEGYVCPKLYRSCGSNYTCPSSCMRTKPSDLTVYVGKTIRRRKNSVSVKSINIHPDWERSLLGDQLESEILHEGIDIAVLELEKPLLLSKDSVWPVCLPVSNDRFMYELDQTVDLYGFGNLKGFNSSPRILQKGRLIIKSSEYCSSQYDDVQQFEKLVCALGVEVKNKRQAGSCSGDSGGGAVSQRRNSQSFVLLALASFGRQDCGKEKRLPSVMTNVLNHVDWIRKIIGKCERKTEDGKDCKFPFLYNGTQHDCCIEQDSDGRSWCVTEIDAFGSNNKDPDTWGYCKETEPNDSTISTTTTSSTTTSFNQIASCPNGEICTACPSLLSDFRTGKITRTEIKDKQCIDPKISEFACCEKILNGKDARLQTIVPGRPECTNYTILSDASRLTSYGDGTKEGSDVDGKWYCDSLDKSKYWDSSTIEKSPDWVGPSWYRFIDNRYDEDLNLPWWSPGIYHCGTAAPGWLYGTHPTQLIGDSDDVKFCFEAKDDECFRSNLGKVTKCVGYYVYYLENTPACRYRYCATNNYVPDPLLPYIGEFDIRAGS